MHICLWCVSGVRSHLCMCGCVAHVQWYVHGMTCVSEYVQYVVHI